jgi:hypothetical protein
MLASVAKLRQCGYRVRVHHKRITEKHPNDKYRTVDPLINPRGGETVVEITDEKSGKTFVGTAKCSIKDNYNKKIGVQLSIERALLSCLFEQSPVATVDKTDLQKKSNKKINKKKVVTGG